MKNIVWKLCLWNVLILAVFCHIAAAQLRDTEEDKPDPEARKFTRVVVGSVNAVPGQAVIVPIYFTPAEGVQVGRLKIEITFVSVNMKFNKLERGIAAEIGNVDLTSDLKPGKNDKGVETSTFKIQTSYSSSELPKEGIHEGLLAYMTLQVGETARPAVIALRTIAEAGELKSNKPLNNVKTPDAQLEVFAPGTQPAVSCFFFSH